MTTADELTVARQASAWMARRVPAADPEEFLSAAWLRVRREREKNPTADRPLLSTAARLAAWDDARSLHNWRRGGGAVNDPAAMSAAVAPECRPPVERRLLTLWCECRGRRTGAALMVRLWAYLWLVEGWTQAQVAAAWGVRDTAVSGALHRHGLSGRPVVPRPRARGYSVRALTDDQTAAVRRDFAALGGVGTQAWIHATAARLGVGHATVRRVVYRCGAKAVAR